MPRAGMQVQLLPRCRGSWIWLWSSSGLAHPVPIPFQSRRDCLGRGRAKAALSQPTVQLSRQHINTSPCATQGALLLHWVANAVLIASSGESA